MAPRASEPARSSVWHEARYSPVKLAAAVDALEESGVAADLVLEHLGISRDDLRDPDFLTSSAQLYETLRLAAQQCKEPGLGLRIGLRLRVTGYGMYGYALLCAPTMRTGLELAMRYHALANPLLPLHSLIDDDLQTWLFPPASELGLPGLNEGLHQLLIEMQMAIHLTLGRDVMGAWCKPQRIRFSWNAPVYGDLIARTFDCPIQYAQPRCEMSYPLSWLDRAPQLANAITAAQTSRECARLIEALAGETSVSRRVYDELMRTPGQFPDIASIAARLRLTDRTLRRHLRREGHSFSALLAGVRRALAEDYLRSTPMSIEDIAGALAFDNSRSFRQAFARWTGQSPTDFRRARPKTG